jgi:hypothetical protein
VKKTISIFLITLAFLVILPVNNVLAEGSVTNMSILVDTGLAIETMASPFAGIGSHVSGAANAPAYQSDLFPLKRGQYLC